MSATWGQIAAQWAALTDEQRAEYNDDPRTMWEARRSLREQPTFGQRSDLIMAIPQQPQRQDALSEQMRDVMHAANRLGCYDAADVIGRWFLETP